MSAVAAAPENSNGSVNLDFGLLTASISILLHPELLSGSGGVARTALGLQSVLSINPRLHIKTDLAQRGCNGVVDVELCTDTTGNKCVLQMTVRIYIYKLNRGALVQ